MVGLDEDQVEHFGAACDGAPVGSFDLQHFSLESIRTALAIPVPEPQEPPLKPAEIQSEPATRPTQPIGTSVLSEPEIDRGNPTVATSTEPETKRSSNSVQAEQRHEAKSYQPRSGKGNGKGLPWNWVVELPFYDVRTARVAAKSFLTGSPDVHSAPKKAPQASVWCDAPNRTWRCPGTVSTIPAGRDVKCFAVLVCWWCGVFLTFDFCM